MASIDLAEGVPINCPHGGTKRSHNRHPHLLGHAENRLFSVSTPARWRLNVTLSAQSRSGRLVGSRAAATAVSPRRRAETDREAHLATRSFDRRPIEDPSPRLRESGRESESQH